MNRAEASGPIGRRIRMAADATPEILRAILALNQQHVAELSDLDEQRLTGLIRKAYRATFAGDAPLTAEATQNHGRHVPGNLRAPRVRYR